MKCPVCGSDVQGGIFFCPHCRFQFNSTDIPIDKNPNPLLSAILVTLRKNAGSQRYAMLCTLYIAITALLIATITNINTYNFVIMALIMVLTLIPVTIVAVLLKK
jgi:hypothetical protein